MRFRLGLLVALVAFLGGGCFGGDDERAVEPKSEELTLRVATFNVFYGGDEMVLAVR